MRCIAYVRGDSHQQQHTQDIKNSCRLDSVDDTLLHNNNCMYISTASWIYSLRYGGFDGQTISPPPGFGNSEHVGVDQLVAVPLSSVKAL